MKFTRRFSYLVFSLIIFLVFIFIVWPAINRLGLYSRVEKIVEDKVSSTKYTVAVELRDLDCRINNFFLDKKVVSINSELPVSAASLIKLPIMVSVYSASKQGKMSLDSVYRLDNKDITGGSGLLKSKKPGTAYSYRELLRLMISQSDNTAANVFIKKLGFDYFNDSFEKMGLRDTRVNRYIMDFVSKRKGIDNYVSVRDISLILERIYRKVCIGKSESEEMLSMLLDQKVDDRIVRYLPKGVKVANKTGTIRGIVHDAGIVFTPEGDYLLCFLTEGAKTYSEPKKLIGKISEIIYYFWNYR